MAGGDLLLLQQGYGWFNAYIKGRIDSGNNVAANYAGAHFRLQPDYTASGGATLRLPVGAATFYATPSASYQSKVSFELPNSEPISQGGYTLVNLRARLELAGGRYRIGVRSSLPSGSPNTVFRRLIATGARVV